MDLNNRDSLQKESPTTTATKAPTSSPKQHQPPLLLNPHHHHTSTSPPPPLHITTTTPRTPQFSRHKRKTTRLKVSKPPRQETCSNPNTNQKEDETQQQNTGSDASLKRKHHLDRKHASAGDKEKASGIGVNNNLSKKRQEATNTTQNGPKKI